MAWLNDLLKSRIRETLDEVEKDKESLEPEKTPKASDVVGAKSIIEDPFYEYYTRQNFFKQKTSRLSNTMLKTVSLRDWLVSSILQIRVDTMCMFGKVQEDIFETGFKIEKKNRTEQYTEEEINEIKFLESFIYHCGDPEVTPMDERKTFDTFLKLLTRDALTFGYVAIEKVFTRGGRLCRLRPLPAENVYLVDKKMPKNTVETQLDTLKNVFKPRPGANDPSLEYEVNEQEIDYYKYVQVSMDLRPIMGFGDEDMIFELFNPQNFADSGGYSLSPLELSIINVMNHMNVDMYNHRFFTHGYAARGIINLKGQVTQSALRNFRTLFYNAINGSNNAWRTPVVAGLDDIQWVSLNPNAKDMEYLSYNNMVMRSICTQFQIDPMELGLDYLISATGKVPSQQSNNKFKIEYSKERGLYPIIRFFENMVNSKILPIIDKDLAKKYRFVFKGYTDETPQTKLALQQAQIALFKSLNDIRSENRLPLIEEPLANLPLNASYIGLLQKLYTVGELREMLLKDKGASKNKSLSYIAGDQNFIAWNELVFSKVSNEQTMQQQKEQQEKQEQMQKEQMEAQQEQAGQEGQEELPEEAPKE